VGTTRACVLAVRSLVASELYDGTVRKSAPLSQLFPATAASDPCAYGVAADAGWHAYVSTVVPGASGDTLLVGEWTMTWPDSREYRLLASVPLGPLGLGGAVPNPSSAVSITTLWLQVTRKGKRCVCMCVQVCVCACCLAGAGM
jgi:hypothetical protein